ncbi:MAG: tetraacyldisaccharide 4'-kinase [Campylobacteraceae bacterium]|nr:tetraacyldisaccharide 4'-kinase [Campylobacteraceae bacterium]MBT7117109.1 tetraacyldisaccharide 4'-kinase [Campylobacteraceae bacterium]
MKNYLYKWVEQYLFFPTFFQQLIGIAMFPLTIIYCFVNIFKRMSAKQKFFVGIPVVSIGNLIVGGSGKTPVVIKLAKSRTNVAVILRGYGRQSTGLKIVSQNGKIKCDLNTSGDEAMLIAQSLPKATVIVSEDRKQAISKAKDIGAKIIFLDDGFSKYDIEKFNILIRPKVEPTNLFCLPSGGYREPKIMYTTANMVIQDGVDFIRVVKFKQNGKEIEQLPHNIICLTAISKPDRLKEFLPKDTNIISYPDHYNFTQEDIQILQKDYENTIIVTTAKDLVKLKQFNIKDIILMDLSIEMNESVDFSDMNKYIKSISS